MSPPLRSRARRLLAGGGLAVASTVLTYLLLELVAFPCLLPHVPLKFHGNLPREVRVLAQSSKRSTFGVGAAGSLTGLVGAPVGIVVYFYGSNDLDNNLEDLRLRLPPSVAGQDPRDRDVFRRFVTTVVLPPHRDWKHFNRKGYEALARAVLTIL